MPNGREGNRRAPAPSEVARAVLARDDGAPAAELSIRGKLEIVSRPPGAELHLARGARRDPLRVLADARAHAVGPVASAGAP
jgi:hypothetical protein